MMRITTIAYVVALLASWPAFAKDPPGREHFVFTERSPHSKVEVLGQRDPFSSFAPASQPKAFEYDIANESFDAFIPSSVKPGQAYGVFVFISSMPEARIMPTWLNVFAKHKLIWICPVNAGNSRPEPIRAGLALDAAFNIARRYKVDPDRVYVSGFSGGGMTASDTLHAFPEVFRGGCLCLNGENFYDGRWNESNQLEPGVMEHAHWYGNVEQLKKQLSIVLVTGTADTVCEPEITISNARGLQLDGFSRTTLINIPGGRHLHPDATWFERAVSALEAKPKPAPTTAPTSQPSPGPDQIAQARRYVATAQALIDQENGKYFVGRAKRSLETVVRDYPTTPSAPLAKELLEWMEKNMPAAK
jgi:hypothetical protein